MPDLSTLIVFSVAALALLVVPGPAVIYIMTRSIDQGRTAGFVSVFGIGVGSLVHISAAALGLSALLVSSAFAFTAVKYIGAAYLIYLGIRKFLEREDDMELHHGPNNEKLSHIFRQGVIVEILNPKTALFFLAFLPQFVDVSKGSVTLQIVVLGMLSVVIAALSDGTYALLASGAGNWLRGNQRFARIQRWLTGGIFVTLGLTAALSGSRATNS